MTSVTFAREGLAVAHKLGFHDVSGNGARDEDRLALFSVGDCVCAVGHALDLESHGLLVPVLGESEISKWK